MGVKSSAIPPGKIDRPALRSFAVPPTVRGDGDGESESPESTLELGLQQIWGANWEGLGRDEETAVTRIDDAIGRLREATLATLRALR